MSEPAITCPNCRQEIKHTEPLAAPLLESTRRQFEQQLARKDQDIAGRSLQEIEGLSLQALAGPADGDGEGGRAMAHRCPAPAPGCGSAGPAQEGRLFESGCPAAGLLDLDVGVAL